MVTNELNWNQLIVIIRLKLELIDKSYLKIYLETNYCTTQFNKDKVTARYPSKFTTGNLKKLKIPLSPLQTQKKIAAILDAADEYRQHTKTLIEKYDQLAQSLFLDMFGDPVINPKEWEQKTLRDLSKR